MSECTREALAIMATSFAERPALRKPLERVQWARIQRFTSEGREREIALSAYLAGVEAGRDDFMERSRAKTGD